MKFILTWIKNHKYCLIMLYMLFYTPYFFLLEHFAVPKFITQSAVDMYIPFIPVFVFPYFTWHILFPSMLVIFMIKDKEDFLKLSLVMFTGMTAALLIYTFLPNGIYLRVPVYGNSVAEKICRWLYSFDSPTNVCPSIHISSTVAIMLVVPSSNTFKNHKPLRIIIQTVSVLICLSTVFIKQHSVYDVISGVALSVVLWLFFRKISISGKQKKDTRINI